MEVVTRGVILSSFITDVPTRQSYVMAVVEEDERAAAGGVTNIVR